MANYDSNYAIAQEISARIGVSPIPFDSVYSIALEIYNELGGEPTQFDSVYSILLGILPLVEGGVADKVIDDSVITTVKTWSSSKINSELSGKASIAYVDEQIEAVAGTANSDIDGKSTEDFHFVTELPQEAEENEQVVIKGDNTDTLYKYVSGSWAEQTPDANILYFDTENEALYSYVTLEHQFAPVSMVNTIVVGSNLNSNAALKAIKTPGVYSVVQRLHSSTKGDYIKNWTLTVEGVDYDEYERTDSVYQRIQSNYTIQKRTWSSTRATNDGWSNFSTYYAGEIKDSTTSKYYTWSSNKLNTELGAKQDALTAGQNISINSANTISADGYVYDETDGSFATKYLNTDDEPYIATNTASGEGAFAEGYSTTATGMGNHAEGGATQAIGSQCAHAEGLMTVASGTQSHAEGSKSVASGKNSHAEGQQTKGYNPTTASGKASHAEGESTSAEGTASHTEGSCTQAKNPAEHAQGLINLSHKVSDNMWDAGNTLHSIGIGYSQNFVPYRKNAVEVMQNGDYYLIGVGGYQGTDTKVQNASILALQDVIANIFVQLSSLDARVTALEPTPPAPTQPNDELWYTTSDSEIILIGGGGSGSGSGSGSGGGLPQVLSNTYEDGKGVIKFAEDLTVIQPYTFYNLSTLTSVQIPSSVTYVDKGAFTNCTNLTSVTVKSNNVLNQYFATDDNMRELFGNQVTNYIIGDGVTSIGNNAFYYCTGLTSVTIGNSVTSIGSDAFYGCGLTSVTIPNSVANIGGWTFYNCTSLASITYNGTMAEWNNIELGDNWNGGEEGDIPATAVHCTDGDVNL